MAKTAWDSFNEKFRTAPTPSEYHGWKYTGYELMTAVEKWAKRWPKDVAICCIDDAHFSSSSIVFILCWDKQTKKKLFGTSVVVIPQNSGQPCDFFMYPQHRQEMLLALRAMVKLPVDGFTKKILKFRNRKPKRFFS